MKTAIKYLALGLALAAAPCAEAKISITSIAAASTIAVNAITIDQTAKRVWKVFKASKHVVAKTAKKLVGK